MRTPKMRIAVWSAGLIAASMIASPPASAQEAPEEAGSAAGADTSDTETEGSQPAVEPSEDSSLGPDIVVTARRREERLQDVPISVAAYSGEEIEAKSIDDIQTLAQFTPNITFASGYTRGKGAGSLFIRGVGQTNTDTQFEPGVGIYLDGVYIASMQGVNIDLLDTERVEVLRGPQGTLFGKNTIGGAMNIVTKRPDDLRSASIQFSIGQRNLLETKAQANLPIVPGTLETRFGFVAERGDGYGRVLDFATGRQVNDLGDRNRVAARALVLLTVSDSFDALFSVDWRKARETNTPFDLINIQPSTISGALNTLLAARGLPLYDARFLTNEVDVTYGTGPHFFDVDAYNLSLTLTWELGNVTLKSISAYRDLDVGMGVDFDGSPYQEFEQTVRWAQTQKSQELQLSGTAFGDRLDWVLGAFYMNFQSTDNRFNNFGGEVFLLGGRDFRNKSFSSADTDSYALFGQGTFALTDRLNVTFGARYTRDERLVQGYQVPIPTVNPTITGGRGTWEAVSGTAAIDYHFNPDTMIYASIGRGYKGGIPENLGLAVPQPLVDPEYIVSYELGFKSELLDRRLRFNTALFYSDYTDLQLQIARIDPATARTTSFIANAASVKIKGLEAELAAYPTDGLVLTAGYGYTDANYDEFEPGVPFAISNALVETPKHTVSASVEYTAPVGASLNLVSRLDYSYKSSIEHDLFNRPGGHQEPVNLLNGRVSLENDDSWSLSFSVTNITNERYTVGSQNVTGGVGGFENRIYAEPRTWRTTAKFMF
jgi:iron complex outermembrane recepter protein